MARVKSTSSRRHREVLKRAKGFKNARRRRIQTAKEAVLHAGQYAYEGRKLKKRDLRALWIGRINAGVRKENLSYSKFIDLLKKGKIEIDRKILAEIAARDGKTFSEIVKQIK